MSKNRWVNTRFWTDTYISSLDPIEKLLFLYFITNDETSLCGAYEIPLRRVAADTGIDKDMVAKILSRFEEDGKISYIDGYIIIVNYRKHQATNTNIQSGIEREENELPEHIRERLLKPSEAFRRNPIPKLKPKLKPLREDNSRLVFECEQFLLEFNKIMGTKFFAIKGIFENFCEWRKTYSLEQMVQAIPAIKLDPYWKDKMDPIIMLRQKNPRNEKVDYIGQLLSLSQKKAKKEEPMQFYGEDIKIPEENRKQHSEIIRENLRKKVHGTVEDG